jgi:hypothetical protein
MFRLSANCRTSLMTSSWSLKHFCKVVLAP